MEEDLTNYDVVILNAAGKEIFRQRAKRFTIETSVNAAEIKSGEGKPRVHYQDVECIGKALGVGDDYLE